ncbi:hypothetical protein FRB96_001041, partial [Tulasnella sp. 330]
MSLFSGVLRSSLNTSSRALRYTQASRTAVIRGPSSHSIFAATRGIVTKRFTSDHEWVEYDHETKIGTVSITDYAQSSLGDVVFVELPDVKTKIEQGDQLGAVESVKAASDIYAPVSGTIVAVNEKLGEKPGLLNKSPEKDGWLCKIELSNPAEKVEAKSEQTETYESIKAAQDLEVSDDKVWAFPNPGTSHSAGTIILVLKDKVKVNGGKAAFTNEILVEGRAQRLNFKWKDSEEMSMVNIYAPNDLNTALNFYQKLEDKLAMRKPTVLMGDFNHIEAAIDRQSNKPLPDTSTVMLQKMQRNLQLEDGWREQNPVTHMFTWTSPRENRDGTRSRSRLDRILISKHMSKRAYVWGYTSSFSLSDHDVVTMEMSDNFSPKMGLGPWKMKIEDLDDEWTTEECRKYLLSVEDRIAIGSENSMRVWLDAKAKIKKIFADRQEMCRVLKGKTLKALKKQALYLKKSPSYPTNIELQDTVFKLDERIGNIERLKMEAEAASSAARYRAKGEQVNKYWFSIGKALTEEATITSLKRDNGTVETSTKKMLDVAVEFHKNQTTAPEMTPEREVAIQEMIELARSKRLDETSAASLNPVITREELKAAVAASQGGKSPGLDGFIYEFYKKWLDIEEHPPKQPIGSKPKRWPKMSDILLQVWNDPRRISKGTHQDYKVALMCPLYKKGDRQDIKNYRPISLLNTDYKLETKCYATKMGKIATK